MCVSLSHKSLMFVLLDDPHGTFSSKLFFMDLVAFKCLCDTLRPQYTVPPAWLNREGKRVENPASVFNDPGL